MKKKFTVGLVAGLSTLALAVPAFAQVTSSSSATGAASSPFAFIMNRPPLTQESVQEMIARDDAFLANIDAFVALQKGAVQTHRAALTAAAAITDETERQEAVHTAHEQMRTTIQEAIEANPDLASGMHMGMKMKMHKSHGMRGPRPEMLAEKLGMTAAELKTALDSGKTLEQLADEKGVELPMKGNRMFFFPFADKLGMTQEELKAALESGKTIEQIAEEKGVDLPAPPMFHERLLERGLFNGGTAPNASSDASAQ